MLYLGILDDKTTQYPFLEVETYEGFSSEYLMYQCLFNEEIVLEEGFLLASGEALNPGGQPQILLEAVRAGLVRVATRYGDLIEYVAERKGVGHPVPPDSFAGRDYLRNLQHACDRSKAFLAYGPDILDRLTFDRFVEALANEGRVIIGDDIWPKDFIERFGNYYFRGNKGGQWTARSALEKTACESFPDSPDCVAAIMVIANRERQILRGAAIQYYNRLTTPLFVETGYTSVKDKIVLPAAPISKASHRLYEQPTNFYPNLDFKSLVRNYKLLFRAFTGAGGAYLRQAKSGFLNAKANFLTTGNDADLAQLQCQSAHYEEQIKLAISQDEFKSSFAGTIVGALGSKIADFGIDLFACAATAKLTKDIHRKYFDRRPIIECEVTRRMVLSGVLFGFAGGLVGAKYLAGNAAADGAISAVQYAFNSEFQENPIRYMNSSGTYKNPKSVHQRIEINRASAARLFETAGKA